MNKVSFLFREHEEMNIYANEDGIVMALARIGRKRE